MAHRLAATLLIAVAAAAPSAAAQPRACEADVADGCGACLSAGCGWAVGRCHYSCLYAPTDVPCYEVSGEDDTTTRSRGEAADEICAISDAADADAATCAAAQACGECVGTLKTDGTPCVWFADFDFCSAQACGHIGCGETTCALGPLPERGRTESGSCIVCEDESDDAECIEINVSCVAQEETKGCEEGEAWFLKDGDCCEDCHSVQQSPDADDYGWNDEENPCMVCEGRGASKQCYIIDCAPLNCQYEWCTQCPEGTEPTLAKGACCEECTPVMTAEVTAAFTEAKKKTKKKSKKKNKRASNAKKLSRKAVKKLCKGAKNKKQCKRGDAKKHCKFKRKKRCVPK